MTVVADTNVFLAVALNEPEKDRIIELTVDAAAIAPEILPYEIGNALSAMVKRRKLSQVEALETQLLVSRIPVRLAAWMSKPHSSSLWRTTFMRMMRTS